MNSIDRMEKIILYGGGGHARVVVDCLTSRRQPLAGFVDDNPQARLLTLSHLGSYDPSMNGKDLFIIAVGNNQIRKEICRKIVHHFGKAIHSTALISDFAQVAEGCMIFHQSVIQSGTTVGSHVIFNTASQVDHDCVINDFAHIGPGAVLCGNVTVGEGTLIGAGAVILPGIKIGKWTTVGAGAVITKDLPDNSTAIGTPGVIINARK